MDMQVPLGVRKGGWIEEEDCLLKKCVEKHGEGNWHQVPRKAGRLPGRTSNDVKNYWNTHLHKKPNDQIREDVQKLEMTQSTMEKIKVIRPRPRPRTFSKNLHCLMGKTVITDKTDQIKENFSEPFQTRSLGDDDGILWWDNMLSDPDINIGMMTWNNEEVVVEGGGEKEKLGMQGAGRDPFRLPGRTSNDVKNYWNTHLHKKLNDQIQKDNLPWLMGKTVITDKTDQTKENFSKPFQIPSPGDDNGILWWDNMLSDPDINREMITWTNEEVIMEGGGEQEKSSMRRADRDPFRCVQEDQNGWSDFLMDNMDLRDVLGDDLK
ncbi:hypothetical protein RHSIM_Rhsim08G0087600 [Rhododendron simsii]|uniref:Uncharacterized protein n=1 Tax=Rhododendron simsii TaxID=118357 RepID=A0A834GIF6_RHOSS|nr:hypothetical protein RHSIM_Rhsim08G0087600 [Rhododendron simsii]